MKLHKLTINGFRRLKDVEVHFGDATFCIGPNNSGKSSLLHALEWLLSGANRLPETEYYSEKDPETGETKVVSDTVVLEAEFRNVPEEANEWRGFKGRLFSYDPPEGSGETGVCIFYRKTYPWGKDVVVELLSRKRELKDEYKGCNKPSQLIDAGVDADLVKELFDNLDKTITAREKVKLDAIDDIWEVGTEEEWFPNPGGIPGNVLSKLPRFLRIPAEASAHEIDDPKRGILGKTLTELFKDVRDDSDNYKEAQAYLNKLAKELDPQDDESEFGKMMAELNGVLASVFPESNIHATADLSDPNKALVPSFAIEMSSNIRTPVNHQGTGMVRSAVFGMLRFRQKWLAHREGRTDRSIIIGFEEPEIYLHPSAANQMRDTIYELSHGQSQIVATTHSPYLIDLSRKPRQVLNRFSSGGNESFSTSFSVTDEFSALSNDDKTYVKLILKVDDYVARAFFTKTVIVVEGDTEDVVFREAINRLPEETRLKIKSDFEVIKARGKASIIGLAKYFNALGVDFKVIHDRDSGTPNAEAFNEPIGQAVGNGARVLQLHECMEDVLNYPAPSKDKPFKAFKHMTELGDDWDSVPGELKSILGWAFDGYL